MLGGYLAVRSNRLDFYINTFVKLFALLTPFAAVAYFISFSAGLDELDRRKAAVRTAVVVIIMTLVIFISGEPILRILGITVDAFRIGTGSVLFLSSIALIRGTNFFKRPKAGDDFAIVPLAIPIIVGPGTIGYLIVLSTEHITMTDKLLTILALLSVISIILISLIFSGWISRRMGARGLAIMSKLVGLILCAMAAQIVCEGIQNIFR